MTHRTRAMDHSMLANPIQLQDACAHLDNGAIDSTCHLDKRMRKIRFRRLTARKIVRRVFDNTAYQLMRLVTQYGFEPLYQQALQKTQQLRKQLAFEQEILEDMREDEDATEILDLCACQYEGLSNDLLDDVRRYLGLDFYDYEQATKCEIDANSSINQKLVYEEKRHEELEFLIQWITNSQEFVERTQPAYLIIRLYREYRHDEDFESILDAVKDYLRDHR